MPDMSSIIARNPRVEFQGLADGEGGVLLHLDTAAYHSVNEIGATIWRLLDSIMFADLLGQLRDRLEDVPPTFDQEIAEFVDDLVARDLVILEPADSGGDNESAAG
jgi:Coenzyme PQQ synthesis protein D (PqqD)